MPLTLDRIMELVRKFDALGAEIAHLDEQRAGLEAERAAVKDELEGRQRAKRAAAVRPPVMAAAGATPISTSSAPPSKPPKAGTRAERIAAELRELAPFYGSLSDQARKCIEARAAGKMPDEIAKSLKMETKIVSQSIYLGAIKLRAARESGAKAKPGKAPANDSEDGPARATPAREQLDELDAYNAGAAAPVIVETPAPSIEEPKQERSDVMHLWSPDSGGTPACGLPRAFLGDSPDRRPGEIDPEVDLSEFFPEEPEVEPAPAASEAPTLVIVPTAPPAPGVPIDRVRGKTIAASPIGRSNWNKLNGTPGARQADQPDDYPEDVERPRTRGECKDLPRPCPFVTCHHHLYLDVNDETGSIKLNFPQLEVWEMAETCSLDVADRGGITLEETGAIMNLTRERIRQIEVRGLDKIREHADELETSPERGESPLGAIQSAG